MNLVVIGVNHKTAPVSLRERLAFVDEDIYRAQRMLQKMTAGSIIISTCNRTEIYALAPATTQPDAHNSKAHRSKSHTSASATQALIDRLIHWIAEFKHLPVQEVAPYLYDYIDTQALTHWLRVASGLDSMILGEPQIFGQIKQSVNRAKAAGFMSNHLNWVTEQIFAAAKQVRSDTDVGTQALSLGFAAAKLVTQIFDNPRHTTLLVVAAGEMNRLVTQNIAELGVSRILICNRTPERAERLAAELAHPDLQIEVHPLSQLSELLPRADIVSSCSGSMNTLIDKAMTRRALKLRRYQPMLMVDLAVPRDIEPDVAKLDDIYLYSIDDLQHVIAGNLEKRRQAAVEAELLVSHLVVEIERRYQVRKVGQDIHIYRTRTEQKAQAILTDTLQSEVLQQLASLDAHSAEQVETLLVELTRRLTQTLSHAPSRLMREVARDGDPEMLDKVITALKDAYRKD